MWGVRVPAWLCNLLSIAALEAMQIQTLASQPFLRICLRPYAPRPIAMLLMILPALTNAELRGTSSLSVLPNEQWLKEILDIVKYIILQLCQWLL